MIAGADSVALNPTEVTEFGLPPLPGKATDSRVSP